jgi:hypothetical protein
VALERAEQAIEQAIGRGAAAALVVHISAAVEPVGLGVDTAGTDTAAEVGIDRRHSRRCGCLRSNGKYCGRRCFR